jgi:ABC-type glycerol-3-phosphate transport system substrate-binding protein
LWVAVLAWIVFGVASGCSRPAGDPVPEDQGPPERSVHLRLLVVDDPALAVAIDQLKGEWNAQTGSTFEVAQATKLDLSDSGPPEADAMIVASWQLAELGIRSWIVPVPAAITDDRPQGSVGTGGAAREGGWAEIFPLVRAREAAWGNRIFAVPFGSPVLTLYCRADLLEKLGAKPPRNWTEYLKLARLLEDRGKLGEFAPPEGAPWLGTMEPLAPGWAGALLLARAASYATHRANYSAVFQLETMEPLIDGPPFVRALEEQVEALGKTAAEHLRADPGDVRRAFWAGRCGMAITWPSSAQRDARPTPSENPKGSPTDGKDAKAEGREIRLSLAELPGSTEVYNIASQAWETRRVDEDARVPLLGVAGRLGVVTTRCAWSDAAFRLLAWLSGQPSSRAAAAFSPATTLFRQSDLRFPQVWTEANFPPALAAQYALLTQQTLSREQAMFALRIPGRAEYLAALDEAVQQAVLGRQKPLDALRQVKLRWQEITSRLGLDRQREAYRRSLGL